MELMYNFLTNTALSLGGSPAQTTTDMMAHRFVEIGFKQPFVLHALLALSALHLFSKDRSNTQYFFRGVALRDLALQQVQPQLLTIQEDDAAAVFIFAAFTGLFTLAEVILDPRGIRTDPIEDILKCFRVMRGTATVITPHWNCLRSSWLQPMLEHDDTALRQAEPVQGRIPSYPAVQKLMHCLDESDKAQMLDAADRLFAYLAASTLPNEEVRGQHFRYAHNWPIEIQAPVLEMLSRRAPSALILLAYYAVLMSQTPDAWVLKGWPEMLMSGVEQHLHGGYAELLRWPRAMLDMCHERDRQDKSPGSAEG
ncbi:hypothetical protein LTR85_004176 [Meristemomyces frigidus]|nr:hypothetical protein LTR85_004176 [Meristemomyces frigidus]